MKIGEYQGYEVHVPTSGGKAGKGCNVTSSVQVVRVVGENSAVVMKQFRFTLDSSGSRREAVSKARVWIDDNPILKGGPKS